MKWGACIPRPYLLGIQEVCVHVCAKIKHLTQTLGFLTTSWSMGSGRFPWSESPGAKRKNMSAHKS